MALSTVEPIRRTTLRIDLEKFMEGKLLFKPETNLVVCLAVPLVNFLELRIFSCITNACLIHSCGQVENTSSGKCTKMRSDIETFSCLLLAHQFFALPLESIDPIDYRYTREDVISSSPKLFPTKTAHHVSVSRNG